MRAQTLSMRQGWSWLASGFAIFRRNPPLLAALVFTYWMLISFISLLPGAGMVAATLSIPAFSVGLMQAARELDAGNKPRFEVLFVGFRQDFPILLQLGGLYLGSTLLVLAASSLADGGQLMRLMLAGQAPPIDESTGVVSPDFFTATLLALAFAIPFVMAFWYAPMLAAWHKQPAVKALFFSFVSAVQNWRAFVGYTAALFVYAGLLPKVIVAVLQTLVPASDTVLQTLVTVPILFVLAPTVQASFYASYRDVFTIDEHV